MYNYILKGDDYIAVAVKSEKNYSQISDYFIDRKEYTIGSLVIKNPKIMMVKDFIEYLPFIF